MPAPANRFAATDGPIDILNWRRFDARLTTSGQPSEEQLGTIGTLGITHVVNLGLTSHEKALADERAAVTALGMSYTHIPVDFAAPEEDDFAHFSAVLAERQDQKIHVHCIYNARVSAFLYRYQLQRAEELDRAAALMGSIWRPGGVWARFIGNPADAPLEHRYAGRDY